MMFIFTVILPTWVAGYFSVFYFPALLLGVIPSPSEVQIIGHSMLPTLEEDKLENVYLYSSVAANFRKLQRGDIVVFNAADLADGEAVSYIKRVVAIPGDRIEIRDGFFYLNGEITVEPYTLKPRSTFGSKDFLPDCKEVVVSDKHVFVLGDNRARSRDSRDLGFISISSITGTIPYSKQEKLKNKWRDVSHDKERAGLASFEANDYYQLLNEKRQEAGLPLLVVNEKLEVAARKRARAIIENNEIDISPSDSKYPIDKAQREAGYFNIVHGEIFTYGYFDAEDLLGHYFEFGEKYLLNKEYQDAGVGAVVGKINGCEVQVIVQEFGGYVPPNYNQENIDSWRNILLQLKEVQPSWARLKDYQEFYEKNKTDIDRINEILSIRIANISTIVAKMEANQWLTAEERKMADQDKALYEEQESLAKKLNSQ
jgi:signal peptidase I